MTTAEFCRCFSSAAALAGCDRHCWRRAHCYAELLSGAVPYSGSWRHGIESLQSGGEYPAFQNEEHPAAGTAAPVQQFCCAPGADEFADIAAPGLAVGQTERGFYDAGPRLKTFSKFSLQTFPWIMSRT